MNYKVITNPEKLKLSVSKKPLLCLSFIVYSLSFIHAQTITTVAGNGTGGYSGDGGPATAAEINTPYGVAGDATGNLYIADANGHRIREVNTNGIITTIAGTGTYGFSGDGGPATAAKINTPEGIAVDVAGNVYIADSWNARIRKINTSGIISTIAGNGIVDTSGDGGQATAAHLVFPEGLTIDATGNLYFADGYRVRKINTANIITRVAGDTNSGHTGDGGPAIKAGLWSPNTVAVDASGNIFIAEEGSDDVRIVNTSGIINTFAGNTFTGFSGDGGPATAAKFDYPFGLAIDGTGNVFISDWSNNLLRYVNTSNIVNVYAGIPYSWGFSGDGGPATAAKISGPNRLFIDGSGNLYMADVGNQRVRKISPAALSDATPAVSAPGILLYPNPSNGVFQLGIRNKQLGMTCNIEIYNILGEKVYSQIITSSNYQIDLSNQPAGIYLLKLQSEDGSMITKKIEVVR
jgi:sugar lactone lactonase YvrE